MADRTAERTVSPPVAAAVGHRESGFPAGRPLLLLWFLWAGLLFGGFILGGMFDGQSDTNHIPRWCRMTSSATLVVAGCWAAMASRGSRVGRFAWLIAGGMALGFLGDLFNADLLPIGLPNPVLGAIVAFGLGHILYIWACVDLERTLGLAHPARRWAAIVAWLVAGGVGWYLVAFQPERAEDLVWPALPYSLLLAGTAGITSGLALQDRRFVPLALGGALFLFSDLVLAWRLFHGDFYLVGDVVWLLYGPAQMLIVYSIVSAWLAAHPPAALAR